MKIKKLLSTAILLVICLTMLFVLASCGEGEQGPQGEQGPKGEDGLTPTISISEDGYWVINGEKTNVKAEGSSADADTSGLDFFPTDDGTYIVALGNAKYLSNIVIPSTYNGKAVTGIVDEAFSDCTNLVSITIPDSVISIGDRAFEGCTSLASITIGNGVTSIGYDAFYGCTNLTSVTIGNGVTSIGNGVFNYCVSLSNITVDEDNTVYKSIDGNLYTKDGKTLMQYALGKEDTTFVVPDGVEFIGNHAFGGCTRLASVVIPDSVSLIYAYAFSGCTGLTEVGFGENSQLAGIGSFAFRGCTGLKSIEIPNSVTLIYDAVFYGCTGLESITLPDSVTSIGGWTFDGCEKLTIYCDAEAKPSGWITNWNCSRPFYWAGEWEYDTEGNPAPITDTDDEMNGTYGLSHIVAESISNGTENTYRVGEYFFGMLLSSNTITPVLNNGTGTLSYTFGSTVSTNITYEVVDDKFIMVCEDAVDLFNDGNPQSRYELLIEEIDGETYFILKASNGVYNFSYYVVKQDNT